MSRKDYKVYILFKNGSLIDVWTNLKKLCSDMNETTLFYSYSTLSKQSKEDGKLSFSTKDGANYEIIIKVLR